MRNSLFFAFVLAGYGLPAFAFFQRDAYVLGTTSILLGVAWMVTYLNRWFRYNPIGLVIGIMCNAYTAWFFPIFDLQVISATFTLAAWDLTRYEQRLQLASSEDPLGRLSQRHLNHLLVFVLASVLLGLGTIQLRVKLDFEVAIILLMITFIGLIQLVKMLLENGR